MKIDRAMFIYDGYVGLRFVLRAASRCHGGKWWRSAWVVCEHCSRQPTSARSLSDDWFQSHKCENRTTIYQPRHSTAGARWFKAGTNRTMCWHFAKLNTIRSQNEWRQHESRILLMITRKNKRNRQQQWHRLFLTAASMLSTGHGQFYAVRVTWRKEEQIPCEIGSVQRKMCPRGKVRPYDMFYAFWYSLVWERCAGFVAVALCIARALLGWA